MPRKKTEFGEQTDLCKQVEVARRLQDAPRLLVHNVEGLPNSPRRGGLEKFVMLVRGRSDG
jgi:hypothetical protein